MFPKFQLPSFLRSIVTASLMIIKSSSARAMNAELSALLPSRGSAGESESWEMEVLGFRI